MVDRWDRAGWIRLVKPGMAPVELARFMTAYGGAITHEVDVTRLAPLLTGHCEFEVFIDTWVSPAWKVDAELVFTADTVGEVNPPAWALGALFPDGGLTAEKPSVTAEVNIPRAHPLGRGRSDHHRPLHRRHRRRRIHHQGQRASGGRSGSLPLAALAR